MDTLWRFGLAVTMVVVGCVPTPNGRTAPESPAVAASLDVSGSGAPGDEPREPNASPSFIRPRPTPSPTFLAYEVRPGDSLTSIARLFGTTARSLAYWNRDRYPSLDPDSETYSPNRIVSGWTLLLIPTEVVAEDDLPDPPPTPASVPASAGPGPTASPD